MSPFRVALACVAAAILWWTFTVQCNYGGNVTGLFTHGGTKFIPPGIAHENVFIFKNAPGFDGQFFHYMAHDPLIRTDYWQYMDTIRLRYRRILVPGLAYVLAFGQHAWIHATYIAVMALFLFGGVFATSHYALLNGLPAWAGVMFLAVPASLISIDRMAVDMPAAACIAGYIVLAMRGSRWPLYLLLIATPLVRETGNILIGSHVVLLCLRRRFFDAALFATAVIPAVAWGAYVATRTPAFDVPIVPVPFATIIQVLEFEPVARPPWQQILKWLHVAAVFGAWIALGFGLRTVLKTWRDPLQLPLLGFSGIAVLILNGKYWFGVYDFDRLTSPLLLLLLLAAMRERRWWLASPLLLITPRTAMEAAWQLRGVEYCFLR